MATTNNNDNNEAPSSKIPEGVLVTPVQKENWTTYFEKNPDAVFPQVGDEFQLWSNQQQRGNFVVEKTQGGVTGTATVRIEVDRRMIMENMVIFPVHGKMVLRDFKDNSVDKIYFLVHEPKVYKESSNETRVVRPYQGPIETPKEEPCYWLHGRNELFQGSLGELGRIVRAYFPEAVHTSFLTTDLKFHGNHFKTYGELKDLLEDLRRDAPILKWYATFSFEKKRWEMNFVLSQDVGIKTYHDADHKEVRRISEVHEMVAKRFPRATLKKKKDMPRYAKQAVFCSYAELNDLLDSIGARFPSIADWTVFYDFDTSRYEFRYLVLAQ